MQKNGQLETILENWSWVRRWYIICMRGLKYGLSFIGFINWLDQRIHKKLIYHHIRSLFAIHHLEDFIKLDVPWWTYPAIKEVEKHLQTLPFAPVIFEYGSGASTIWLAKRAAQVFSIEHDRKWYQNLKNQLRFHQNVCLLLKEAKRNVSDLYFTSGKFPNRDFYDYVHAIKDIGCKFDVIIIDGRCREACLKTAIPYLKPHGFIVFDNSNRKRYQEALYDSHWEVLRYPGLVPGSPLPSETAILRGRGRRILFVND